MHKPAVTQQVYQKLNQEYQELLEKNQNDLIKIKMRQKQLNEKIAGIQKQNDILRQQLQTLKDNLKKQGNYTKSIQEGSDQQTKIKELSSTNECQRKQIQALKNTVAKLIEEGKQQQKIYRQNEAQLLNLRKDLEKANIQIQLWKNNCEKEKKLLEKALQTQISEKTEQLLKEFNQKQTKSSKTIQQLQQENNNLSQKVIQSQKYYLDLQRQLEKRQAHFLAQADQYKKQFEEKVCLNCKDLEQNVQLHQEMLKSVKMMLKFKEMELQKLKN